MKIRQYLRIKRRVAEIRAHVQNYHDGADNTMIGHEIVEDGIRMEELCGYVDDLMRVLEQEEDDDD